MSIPSYSKEVFKWNAEGQTLNENSACVYVRVCVGGGETESQRQRERETEKTGERKEEEGRRG